MESGVLRIMIDRRKLSPLEKDLLEYLEQVGYDSAVCLRIRFRINRISLNHAIQTLYKTGVISRSIQGLVIHLDWLKSHPEDQEWIAYTFKRSIS